jgi:hypothetical protein
VPLIGSRLYAISRLEGNGSWLCAIRAQSRSRQCEPGQSRRFSVERESAGTAGLGAKRCDQSIREFAAAVAQRGHGGEDLLLVLYYQGVSLKDSFDGVGDCGGRETVRRSNTQTVSTMATTLIKPRFAAVSRFSMIRVASGDGWDRLARDNVPECWCRGRSSALRRPTGSARNSLVHLFKAYASPGLQNPPKGRHRQLRQKDYSAIRMQEELHPVPRLQMKVLPNRFGDRGLSLDGERGFHTHYILSNVMRPAHTPAARASSSYGKRWISSMHVLSAVIRLFPHPEGV